MYKKLYKSYNKAITSYKKAIESYNKAITKLYKAITKLYKAIKSNEKAQDIKIRPEHRPNKVRKTSKNPPTNLLEAPPDYPEIVYNPPRDRESHQSVGLCWMILFALNKVLFVSQCSLNSLLFLIC